MSKTIGLLSNPNKPESIEVAKTLTTMGKQFSDVKFMFDEMLTQHLDCSEHFSSDDEMSREADLIVVLGGDGTLLNAVKRIKKEAMPFLGINLGGLGFLTEFSINTFSEVLRALDQDQLKVGKRMMLEVTHVQNTKKESFEALNECALTKGTLSRVINFEVSVDDQYLNTFSADGFIVATPTGSTAYSLSSGGPLVQPETELLLLTPISPHTLSNRPLIVGADKNIKIQLRTDNAEAGLTIDGQVGRVIKGSDVICIKKSSRSLHLVSSGVDYFDVLRKKFGWRGASTPKEKSQ